ncbi:MAG: hypothetical protein AAFQ43_04950 [Bacteroidota bacterium]
MLKVLLWLLLFAVVAGGAVAVALRLRNRREREKLWGALDGEPSLPEWNEKTLGVSPVRVHTDHPRLPAEPEPVPASAPEAETAPEPLAKTAAPDPFTETLVEAAPDASETPEAETPEAETPNAPAPEAETRSHLNLEPEAASGESEAAEIETDDSAEPVADDANAEAHSTQAAANDTSTDDALTAPAHDALLASEPNDSARPMRPRPEWWEDDLPGTGALLRSLVTSVGGSAALVRPSPDGGYLVLAAAGPTSAALHANPDARRLDARSRVLDDLAREVSTVVLGSSESGLLPGMEPGGVGETAVRTLAASPAPRRLLVTDIPLDHPLDSRRERLIVQFGDLLADLLGLHDDAVPTAIPTADPMRDAMERIGQEMVTARDTGRQLAFALVVPENVDALSDGDTATIGAREAVLRQRLASVPGSRLVEPMGEPFVYGVLCEADGANAERWARAAATSGDALRIGIAIYRPRHVTPDLLRQEAAHALHQAYVGDDSCVIVD